MLELQEYIGRMRNEIKERENAQINRFSNQPRSLNAFLNLEAEEAWSKDTSILIKGVMALEEVLDSQ